MTGYFVLKVLVILDIVPKSVDTCRAPGFIVFWDFKWPLKVSIKTGSYPEYGIFDDTNRQKREPFSQLFRFKLRNNEVFSF